MGRRLFSIGEVSRRTGLTVKTIRFYADRGIVQPTCRNSAGQRVFDAAAVARLELVRTLRDVGLELSTIGRVVDGQISLAEIAATHAEALSVQIHLLRRRRAVLMTVANRESTIQEMQLMNKLATLSGLERQRLVDEFLDSCLGDHRRDPGAAGIARSLTPELPDDADSVQVEAWIELAELLQNNEFRIVMGELADQYAADRARDHHGIPRRDLAAVIRDRAGTALAAGIDPTSDRAEPVVATIIDRYRPDPSADRDAAGQLLEWLVTLNDPRRERYLRLLSVINQWPPPETLAPVVGWSIAALQARMVA